MFSVSNVKSNEYGDQEYNTIKLRDQLQKGQIVYTISCQDVKVSLPANFDTEMDKSIKNTIDGVTKGLPNPPNPSFMFDFIRNHIGNETQRINNPENNNSSRKSFLQIMIENIINLMAVTLKQYLVKFFTDLPGLISNPIEKAGAQIIANDIAALLSSPSELQGLINDPNFLKKSKFVSKLINGMMAMLIATLFQALLKEVTKIIKNAAAKKAANALKSKKLANA